MFNAKKVKDECVKWIREWFATNGPGCKVTIGISGGKDSSVVAALCTEALGKERVLGVLMPNGAQGDIEDSIALVNHLGISYVTIDISAATRAIKHSVKNVLDDHWSVQSSINLPPRVRMTTLYAVSQTVNGRVANTCNLSEDYVGYSTRWGDAVGDFAPLTHLTSDEVVAIGDALGLPYELTHKVPSDGLCGKTDEDNLGFTYAVLNKYIRTGICEDEQIKTKIDTMHQKNLFKLQPIPSFPYEEMI